jgi:hypothetical protein
MGKGSSVGVWYFDYRDRFVLKGGEKIPSKAISNAPKCSDCGGNSSNAITKNPDSISFAGSPFLKILIAG